MACLGGGPSLSQEQVEQLRGRARVIAVNDAYKLAPFADVLYGCDWRWWRKHNGAPDFAGLKVTLSNSRGHLDDYPDIKVVENTGSEGPELEPTGLRTGRNGGYQAINLVVHLGAARILLIGDDMKADAHGALWLQAGHRRRDLGRRAGRRHLSGGIRRDPGRLGPVAE